MIIFHTTKTLDLSVFYTLLCYSDPEAARLNPKVLLSIGKLSKVDSLERLNPTCSGMFRFIPNRKKLCSGTLHSFSKILFYFDLTKGHIVQVCKFIQPFRYSFCSHMDIALCDIDITMAHQLLQAKQIAAGLQIVCSKGMSERMDRSFFHSSGAIYRLIASSAPRFDNSNPDQEQKRNSFFFPPL